MRNSQVIDLLDVMAECDNGDDFRDLKRILNRHIAKMNKWPSTEKLAARPSWQTDMNYPSHFVTAADLLIRDIKSGHYAYLIKNKVGLIKRLRELSPLREFRNDMWDSHMGLKECKEFIEKHFAEYC